MPDHRTSMKFGWNNPQRLVVTKGGRPYELAHHSAFKLQYFRLCVLSTLKLGIDCSDKNYQWPSPSDSWNCERFDCHPLILGRVLHAKSRWKALKKDKVVALNELPSRQAKNMNTGVASACLVTTWFLLHLANFMNKVSARLQETARLGALGPMASSKRSQGPVKKQWPYDVSMIFNGMNRVN